jgi:hypothetical protein
MKFLKTCLSAFRTHLVVHFPGGERRLWKSCDLECLGVRPLNSLDSNHIPGCSMEVGLSAFRPCPEFHLPVCVCVCVCVSGGWIACDLVGLDSGPLVPPVSPHMQPGDRPWRPNILPVTGLVLCSCYKLRSSGDETCSSPGRVEPPSTVPFTSEVTLLLERYCRTMSDPLLFHNHLCDCLPPKYYGQLYQDSLCHDYSLFSSPQSISVSNNNPSLKVVS